MDNLTYGYSGNRLSWVRDTQTETSGNYQLPDTTRYTYDANGNIKTRKNDDHSNNDITAIIYNHLNLPRTLTTASGAITYVYDAAGRKLRSVNGVPGQTREYIDGIEYTGGTLELIHTEEGRIVKLVGAGYEYQYVLKDHLGNSRVGFVQSTALATTPNFTADYYPFGLQYLSGKRQPSITNHYLYNGKEVQDGLKWVDYGARFYDPVIGRWGVMDPMAENHFNITTYHYVLNRPLFYIDPLGLDTIKYDDFLEDPSLAPKGEILDMGAGNYSEMLQQVTVTAKSMFHSFSISNSAGMGIRKENNGTYYVYDSRANGSPLTDFWVGNIGEIIVGFSPAGIGADLYVVLTGETYFTRESVSPLWQTLGVIPWVSEFKRGFRAMSLVEQAQEISQIAKRNSITIQTPTRQIRYDLIGKAHGNVPVPHMQIYNKNIFQGRVRSITRASRKVIPMTQQDIRLIRKYLNRISIE